MQPTRKLSHLAFAASLLALTLAGCGGGGDPTVSPVAAAALPDAQPVFHRLPDAIAAPSEVDAAGDSLSASQAPAVVSVAADVAGLNTLRLTDEVVAHERLRLLQSATPAATTVTSVVYTPAQIRAAYGLSALPKSYVGLTATAAAALGAGQTVYVIDAYDAPNALSDLNTFSTTFGLPACTSTTIAPTATLPLTAPGTSCAFSKVYTQANLATMTATAPAYNAGWAGETSLDIQWVHAIAPLARVVLIEAPDAGVGSLSAAATLAGKMGPGHVSMSFGAPEGSWVTAYDSVFGAAGVSYFAATGDAGAQVNWPAVSPKVVAVGGTTLAYSGTGARTETVWASTGGGVSLYEKAPTWQASTTKGTYRMVADVAFNANPYSGQYVYMTAQGATTGGWYAYGGTSLSTPQWAGLVTVADAQRALLAKAPLGANLLTALYTLDGMGTANYTTNFLDVVSGSNGTCTLCTAKPGYDVPTGQGTPNAAALLTRFQAN